MIKTYRDLITYCENFQYSAEYYELYKEASELDLMKQYVTSHQYAAYVESSDLMDEILMEALDPEKLKSMMVKFGTKAAEFGSKIVQKLKDLISKAIKFFRSFINKIMNKETSSINVDKVIKAIKENKSTSKAYNAYCHSLAESKISTNANSTIEQDNEVLDFIKLLIGKKSVKLYDLNEECSGLANPKEIANLLNKIYTGNRSKTNQKISKITKSITVLLNRDEINKECNDLEAALKKLTAAIDVATVNVNDRGSLAQDIITRKIRGESAIRNLWNRKEINSQQIGKLYKNKRPKDEWNKEYLTKLFYSVVAESFNLDFLLYLDEVAEYVTHKNPTTAIVANYQVNKYNHIDKVDALNQIYRITASTLDFYSRFAKLYDQTIKLVNETLE